MKVFIVKCLLELQIEQGLPLEVLQRLINTTPITARFHARMPSPSEKWKTG